MHTLSGLGSFMSVLKVKMKIWTSWFAWFCGVFWVKWVAQHFLRSPQATYQKRKASRVILNQQLQIAIVRSQRRMHLREVKIIKNMWKQLSHLKNRLRGSGGYLMGVSEEYRGDCSQLETDMNPQPARAQYVLYQHPSISKSPRRCDMMRQREESYKILGRRWIGMKLGLRIGLPWWLREKNLLPKQETHGFDPWSGKILHAVEQLSLWVKATSVCSRAREPQLLNPSAATTEAHTP